MHVRSGYRWYSGWRAPDESVDRTTQAQTEGPNKDLMRSLHRLIRTTALSGGVQGWTCVMSCPLGLSNAHFLIISLVSNIITSPRSLPSSPMPCCPSVPGVGRGMGWLVAKWFKLAPDALLSDLVKDGPMFTVLSYTARPLVPTWSLSKHSCGRTSWLLGCLCITSVWRASAWRAPLDEKPLSG